MLSSEKATGCQDEGRFHDGGMGLKGGFSRISRNGDEEFSRSVGFQPARLKTC